MALVLSVTLGLGLMLLLLALTGRGRPPDEGRAAWAARWGEIARRGAGEGIGLRDFALLSAGAGLASALAVHAALGWPVVTGASALVGLALPGWYRAQRRARRRAEVQEAVADAVAALRDSVRIGLGLEEAVQALGRTGPEPVRGVFREIERDTRLAGFEEALRRQQERVDDAVFDSLAVALAMSYRVGGRNLTAVFDGLSRSVRAAVRARREIRAEQAKHVLSARVIAALPLLLIATIRLSSPGYLEVFSEAAGQGVLALCLLMVACGYAGMLRAAALPEERRVLR